MKTLAILLVAVLLIVGCSKKDDNNATPKGIVNNGTPVNVKVTISSISNEDTLAALTISYISMPDSVQHILRSEYIGHSFPHNNITIDTTLSNAGYIGISGLVMDTLEIKVSQNDSTLYTRSQNVKALAAVSKSIKLF